MKITSQELMREREREREREKYINETTVISMLILNIKSEFIPHNVLHDRNGQN